MTQHRVSMNAPSNAKVKVTILTATTLTKAVERCAIRTSVPERSQTRFRGVKRGKRWKVPAQTQGAVQDGRARATCAAHSTRLVCIYTRITMRACVYGSLPVCSCAHICAVSCADLRSDGEADQGTDTLPNEFSNNRGANREPDQNTDSATDRAPQQQPN